MASLSGSRRRGVNDCCRIVVYETLGAKHAAILVPECGHNDRCIFTTDVVLPVIFPK